MDEAQVQRENLEGRQLTFIQQITYALGNFGVTIAPMTLAAYLGYFYFGQEPVGGKTIQYLGPVTFGFIWFLCNALNGPTDPIVGYLSDHSRSKWGRRKPFIALGAPFLGLCFFFLWTPITETPSAANAALLFAALLGFWLFFTVVVAPYLSLLPEITPYNNERIRISAFMGVFEIFGTGLGSALPALFGWAAAGFLFLSGEWQTMGFFGAISLVVFFYVAIALVKETYKPKDDDQVGGGIRRAFAEFGSTFKNLPFRPYLVCVGFYRIAVATTVFIAPFLATKVIGSYPLAETDRSFLDALGLINDGVPNWQDSAPILMTLVLFGGLPFFPLISWLARKLGKRLMFVIALFWFSLVLLLIGTVGEWPFLSPMIQAVVLFGFASFPVATAIIVVRPILADVIDADEQLTGQRREGVYNGMEGLIMKVAAGVGPMLAGFIFAGFGSTVEENLGVRLCGPMAGVFLLAAAFAFTKYPIRT